MKHFKQFIQYIVDTFRYKAAINDINNLHFIKSQVHEHKNDPTYKKYNMFFNRWKQLCVLFSLSKDEQEFAGNSIDLEDKIFLDHLDIMIKYIVSKLLLGDLFIPYTQKLEGTYSYKIKFKPVLDVYSIHWIIRNIIFYIGIIFLILWYVV